MIILDEDKGPPWMCVEWWDEWTLNLSAWRVEYDYEAIRYTSPKRLRKMGLLFFGPLVITYGSGASQTVEEN